MVLVRMSPEDKAAFDAAQQKMYDDRAEQTLRESYEAAVERIENGEPNAMSPQQLRAAAKRDGVELDEEPASRSRSDAGERRPAAGRKSRRAGEPIGQESEPARGRPSYGAGDDEDADADAATASVPNSEASGLQ